MIGVRGLLAFVAVTAAGCAAVARSSPSAAPTPVQGMAEIRTPPFRVPPPAPPVAQAPPALQARPPLRWEGLYARYFAPGTEGGCAAHACHGEAMADADSAYGWLAGRGYIAGIGSPLVSPTNSCLRWFGGNMPPRGKANDSAVRDIEAWVADGARKD